MPTNQPARWLPSAPARQHARALTALDNLTELTEQKIAGIAQVEGRAHFEKMKASLVKREAIRLDPDGADEYHMISMASTLGMVNVIDRYSRGR